MEFIFSETYTKKDFTTNWAKWEYEDCEFVACDFSWVDLSYTRFIACRFRECNLSNIVTIETSFQWVTFHLSKLLWIQFQKCNHFLFEVDFEKCILDYSIFNKMKLSGKTFRESSFREVDFSLTDLSSSIFDDCDLQGAIFSRTDLSWADLRDARNYRLDPEGNTLTWARFSLIWTPGLLTKYDIIIE